MKIDRLITLLPCSSLDDLRLDRNSDESEELLSALTGLWHPVLINNAQSIPSWFPATQPPQYPTGYVIVVPECCHSLLPDGWLAEADASEAVILKNLVKRDHIVSAALEYVDNPSSTVDHEIVADFLALGFCRFVVEQLTLKLRYMSNINEDALETAVLEAAKAAVEGDADMARAKLRSAFERLHEAREYFYPTDTRLIDLTLVASSTLGESLRTELADKLPRNLLVSGEVLEEMAKREPASLIALKESLTNNTVSIVGGESFEAPLPMLPLHAIDTHLQLGLESYKKLLDHQPSVFGRRNFGLSLALPYLLKKNGFAAAWHITLDDGQFPTGNLSFNRWEGFDGTEIDALCKIPLDANRADSFFLLPEKIGQAMERDQPASIVFAHWPGFVCPWYDDLRRIFSYSQVLGSFCTLDDYFKEATLSGRPAKFIADQYRSPYLVQNVAANQPDSISRWVSYYRRRATLDSAQTIYALAAMTLNAPVPENIRGLAAAISTNEIALDNSLNPNASIESGFDEGLQKTLDAALELLSQSLTGKCSPHTLSAETAHEVCLLQSSDTTIERCQEKTSAGYLLINPCSFSQCSGVDLPELERAPELAEPVKACDEKHAVVDVPGMGFAWIGPSVQSQSTVKPDEKKSWFFGKKHKKSPSLAEDNVLRNEFFAAYFDPHSGAIRSISDYRTRHPRLAQQIALRTPGDGKQDSESDENYSIMSADEIRITCPGSVYGEIVSRGKIMDRKGRRLAGFRQTSRAWRGSPILELEIELDVDQQPGPNPWNSYYACRFAWSDETSSIYRSVNQTTQQTDLTQFESPHFIDIRHESLRTTILANGLPYHRRIGLRKLDTLLIVQGETARKFRLGVGFDLPNAMSAALGFMAPKTMGFPTASPTINHGWLFHLDHRNVIATHWEPVMRGEGRGVRGEGRGARGANDDVIGFRVCLLETEGRNIQLGLRSFKSIASARKIEPDDVASIDLSIANDRIVIPIRPYSSLDVEAIFT